MFWYRWGLSCIINMLVFWLWIVCYLDECSLYFSGDICYSFVKICLLFMWLFLLFLFRLCWFVISDFNLIFFISVMGYFFYYLRDLIYRVNFIIWEKEFFMIVGISIFWRLRWCWLFILVILVVDSWNFIEW